MIRNRQNLVDMLLFRSTPYLLSRRFSYSSRRMRTLTETAPISSAGATKFQNARFIPPDAIFELTAQYLQDPFPQKVNLGQGTYRDGDGNPWVLPSVNRARETLLAQGLNHEYLPILGLPAFREATAKVVLGSELFAQQQKSRVYALYPLLREAILARG